MWDVEYRWRREGERWAVEASVEFGWQGVGFQVEPRLFGCPRGLWLVLVLPWLVVRGGVRAHREAPCPCVARKSR